MSLRQDTLKSLRTKIAAETSMTRSDIWIIKHELKLSPVNTENTMMMAALRSRCGNYFFVLWFLSSIFLFSSPNLSDRRLDVYHTSIHGVALVRI